MPTYEYKCPDCGHEFEEFQSMTAKPVKKCPSCGKRRVQRLISSGLQPIFKGSGFYETDYVKKSGAKEGASESKAESKTEPSSESKAEAKPAKTETKPEKTKPKPAEKKK